MESIKERLQALKESLPEGVRVVAVSKFHPVEQIQEAYDAGQRIFGESRVQELQAKVDQLPSDIEWHLIGTLQRNKVKYIIPFVHTIHSVDSVRLLQEIDRQCERQGRRKVRVLLQLHISGEETKHGFGSEELHELISGDVLSSLPHLEVAGLMGMASNTEDERVVDEEFARMKEIFDHLKSEYFAEAPSFCELSIGMSEDYHLAIRHGATYVRIGTAIFGERG